MATWGEVVEVTEIRRPNDKGEIVNFYRYQVKTKGGIAFTELVPEVDTEPKKLEAILKKKAERLDATKAL